MEDFTSETPRSSSFSTSTTADYGAGDSIDVEGLDDLFEGDGSSGEDVDEVAVEIERFRELAIRTQADFENYRKRVTNQINDEVDRAADAVAEALPVPMQPKPYVRHPDEIGPRSTCFSSS